jgi:hypothetical protein
MRSEAGPDYSGVPGLSAAIARINLRRSLGKRGLPVGLDFQRQNNRNPFRCHRISVSGFTFTSELPHGNIRLSVAIIHRVASSARRDLTFRSWNMASCLRRKRFSAARALWEWHREASELDRVDDDQRQRPEAMRKGTENRCVRHERSGLHVSVASYKIDLA